MSKKTEEVSEGERLQLAELARLTALSSEAEVVELVESASGGLTKEEVSARVELMLAFRRKEAGSAKQNTTQIRGWIHVMAVFSAVAMAAATLGATGGSQRPKPGVVTLDQSFLSTVLQPASKKSLHTDWAVFFYKPYCGACRRVRPFFHALAEQNATEFLRFAEIDCVRWRPLCAHAGAKSQPMIKLYRQKKDRRAEAASWQGANIAYEVLNWFASLQRRGLISPNVTWPTDDRLAESMRAFKLTTDSRHERVTSTKNQNPALYLKAVDKAWRMSLVDSVFGDGVASISGERLVHFVDWLDALGYALPQKNWRSLADRIRERIGAGARLQQSTLNSILREFSVTEPRDWTDLDPLCTGDRAYPCSLWILFHTLLANSDSRAAPHVLKAIRGFVVDFFGCTECARHFDAMYSSFQGHAVNDALDASIWLWSAHNRVSRRLFKTDADLSKSVPFPDNATCRSCFKANHPNDSPSSSSSSSSPSDDDENDDADYDTSYVFQFLAETYCFESDTFVCAAFDDPTRNKKHRRESTTSSSSRSGTTDDEQAA